MPNEQKRITTWKQALPDVGLVLITGTIREGKSGLAWRLAEQEHKAGRAVAAFAFPEMAQKLLPRWVHHLKDFKAVKNFKPRRTEKGRRILVLDEAIFNAYARRSMSSSNIDLTQFAAISGQMGFVTLLVGQNNRIPDVGLIMETKLALMKRPTELHVRYSRPELRPELEEAFKQFSTLRPHATKKWVYLADYDKGRRGWMRNTLPTFWSEKLSVAFAMAQMASAEAEAKKRKANAARGARRAQPSRTTKFTTLPLSQVPGRRRT